MKYLRPEYPEPQWERENWKNLNGEWEFEFDHGMSAKDRELYKKGALSMRINVPFCPESELSGIGYKDFMRAVCYRKVIVLSEKECEEKVFLHFGAVDYESFIYVNGEEAFHHIGGYSSFKADITKFINPGENEIFVIANDDQRSGKQPRGKQSSEYYSHLCDYTRTTGIWQTVWLEFVPLSYIKYAKYHTDTDNCVLTVEGEVEGKGELSAAAFYEGKAVGSDRVKVNNGYFNIRIALSELHLWELGKGRLYDLFLSFGEDKVKSYFGMRSISLEGMRFMLNGKSVFQRLVLDQGFYPDGIYTAKTDEELKRDIALSMELGFNGARLHQKIFEARFLYHCDKAGYMVWGEHGNWGMDYRSAVAAENFINEWIEALMRDINHPSLIGWCPFNETWGYAEKNEPTSILEAVYKITKRIDPSRPCIDTSGNFHVMTDIYDVHDYCQDPERFSTFFKKINEGIVDDHLEREQPGVNQRYNGAPVFISEYGGIAWGKKEGRNWGYGNAPKSKDEFIKRYELLTASLLDNPDLMGFCYTQLYDVEQEINGLYTYEREAKFDKEIIRRINTKKAAVED